MSLQNAPEAIISPEKIRNYLLSHEHPIGRFKASFFAQLGYTGDNWQEFERDLRQQILGLEAKDAGTTRYGRKYSISGLLTGPSGKAAMIVSVWVVRTGDNVARLVTVYPGR